MLKSKAKKLLAVAMIFAIALSLQIPSFAATLNNMSLSLRAPASGTAGKVDLVVDSDEFDGAGPSAITGTVTLQWMDRYGGTYADVAGTTAQNVTDATDEIVFSDIDIATIDLVYKATFSDGTDETAIELALNPYSFNDLSLEFLSYEIDGANLLLKTGSYDAGLTGTILIEKSIDNGTNWERVTESSINSTSTHFEYSMPYPTASTNFRITYTPDQDAILKGYNSKVTEVATPYKVGLFTPVTIAGYGYDPAALTISLNDADAVTAGYGMQLEMQSEADRLAFEAMSLSQSLMVPAGYSLFAALDLRLTSDISIPNPLDTVPHLGETSTPVPFTLSGLRPGSQVAVIRIIGDTGYRQDIYTVDATGSISSDKDLPRSLSVEVTVDALYTTDSAGTVFIYTNYAPATPTPTPVPVSPSTGVYN